MSVTDQTPPGLLSVRPLAPGQLRDLYPLMRAASPALSLQAWLHFARALTASKAPGHAGILVARRHRVSHPCGAVCYRRDRDLQFGIILTAEHFIAMDLLYPEAVMDALLGELDNIAMRLRCNAIRSIVQGGRVMLADELRGAGHVSEGFTMTKSFLA
jgi:hypothetical protein